MIKKEKGFRDYRLNGKGNYLSEVKTNNNDEIDLLDLVRRMISFVLQYKATLLSAPVIGVVIGLIYYLTITPLYKSEMIFEVSALEKNELGQVVKELNNHLQNKNASAIKGLNPDKIYEMSLLEQEGENSSHVLSVVVTDPAYLRHVQEYFVSYISENDFTAREIIAEKYQIEKTLAALRNELIKVDQVLSEITDKESVNSENLADLFTLKIEIQKEQIELENRLKHLEGVTIIRDFPQYSKAYNKNLWIIVCVTMVGATILTIGFLICKEIYGMVVRSENTELNHSNGFAQLLNN